MRKNLAMAFLSLLLLTGAATMLTACNTAAGVGEDVSAVGHTVTGGAERLKPY
jgi:entericidin A